jgi:hypothetical protein
MPAIVVCAACQTKLKVPEKDPPKALRCPKCKGIVPVAAAAAKKPRSAAAPKPAADEEQEVNEPADDEKEHEVNEAADEEHEVNEPADDEEEHEVNEAANDEESDEEEESDEAADEDSALAELGFAKVKDVFKQGELPDEARKAIEKSFVKNEKPVWAGRPSVKIIESKAWIGLVAGPIVILLGLGVCLGSGLSLLIPVDTVVMKIIFLLIGGLVGTVFTLAGVLAIIFRKRIGGNVAACYVVTNKRAYIYDGGHAVRAFTPKQLESMKVQGSANFPGAGDLIFGYDFMGDQGVLADKEDVDRFANTPGAGGGQSSTPVGFLNIEDVQIVKRMINEVLVEPAIDSADAKAKAKKKKQKEKEKARKNHKPFG